VSDGAQSGGDLDAGAGQLAQAGVAELVPLLEGRRRTGVLHLRGPAGQSGAVWIREGRVVDAEAGRRTGEAAFHEVAGWREGTWSVAWEPVERRRAIALGTCALLAEAARRAEELARLADRLPDPAHPLEIDYRLLSDRLADIPDDVNGVLKLVDGRRTLADLLAEADVDRLAAAEALARLHADGVVRAAPRAGAAGVDWFARPRGGEAPPAGDGSEREPRIVRFPSRSRGPASTPALPFEAVVRPPPAARPLPPEPPPEPEPEQPEETAAPPAPALAAPSPPRAAGPPRPAPRRSRRRAVRRAWAIAVAAGLGLGAAVGAGAVAWRRAPAAEAGPGAGAASAEDAEYARRLDAAHRKYLAGNFVSAVGEYRNAVAARETSAAWFGLGRALAGARQPALAVDALERAVALDAQNADAYIALGQVYAAENRAGDARRAFARYLELSPAGEQASDVRAQLSRLGGRSE
jgi:tetratricopeptide (TPR) repeat protein